MFFDLFAEHFPVTLPYSGSLRAEVLELFFRLFKLRLQILKIPVVILQGSQTLFLLFLLSQNLFQRMSIPGFQIVQKIQPFLCL